MMTVLMRRGWNCWLTAFHHDHSAHLRAVTLILTLSLQPSTLLCPLSFEPPTAPSLIPQQAHSPQERIRDRLKDSRLFLRVHASVLLSAPARNKWTMSKSYEGVEWMGQKGAERERGWGVEYKSQEHNMSEEGQKCVPQLMRGAGRKRGEEAVEGAPPTDVRWKVRF